MSGFMTQLSVSSATAAGKQHIYYGSQVILPPYALQQLTEKDLQPPWQFRISTTNGSFVFCGVLTFDAQMGQIVVPDWMFAHLKVRQNAVVRLESSRLPQGALMKIQPHESAFVQLSDPRAVLERKLESYPVLTRGTTIEIFHAGRAFHIGVVSILNRANQPLEAITTIAGNAQPVELKVEFDRPLDMPPSPEEKPVSPSSSSPTGSPSGRNVVGSGSAIQFKPLNFKPPSLSDDSAPSGGASTAAAAGAAGAGGTGEQPQAKKLTPFSGTGRSLGGAPPAARSTPTSTGKSPAEEESSAKPAPATATAATGVIPFAGKGRSLKD